MDTVFNFISTNLNIKKKTDLLFPFLDYGFLYGYGLFETIKIQDAHPVLLNMHCDRLRDSAIILDIPFLYSNQQFSDHVKELIEKNNCNEAVLNIYLTPGDRDGDPAIHNITHPFLLMVVREWPGYQHDQQLVVEVREQSFQRTRLDRYKTLAWMKNCLEHRLSDNCDDVLLYDEEQVVLEASRSNVLFIKGKNIISPDSKVILNGVTRNFILSCAKDFGFNFIERKVYVHEMPMFDEVFLTNSLRGVCLVERLGEFGISSKEQSLFIQTRYLEKIQKLVNL